MPRSAKSKTARRHETAAQLPSKRAFAANENQVVEPVIPGEAGEAGELEDDGPASQPVLSSKRLGKQPASALVPDLPTHPYSRSHTRREKRKQKNQLIGGELDDISAALDTLIQPEPEEEKPVKGKPKPRRKEKDGKIGEGKGRTLTETSRRKQIALEAKRIPAIMAHPAYKQNPWAAIRMHAGNSLATNDGPKPVQRAQGAGTAMVGVE